MEGIYQNNLYSQQSPSYILQSGHQTDHTSYSNYGNPYHRTSAFSDARSYQPNSSASPSSTTYPATNTHYTTDFHHNNNTHSLNWSHSNNAWNTVSSPLPPPSSNNNNSRHNSFSGNTFPSLMSSPLANTTGTHLPRPKLTTTVWEDESTVCYQVDAKGVCVARRQDNDMINGTKLLNVVGMSRGKRDGILKNEKGRVVVKVGAMHLKGVWITFERARDLATKFKIADILYPLFIDNPTVFLPNAQNCNSSNHIPSNPSSLMNKVYTNNLNNSNSTNNFSSFNMQSWDKHYPSSLPSIHHASQDQMLIRTQPNENGSCSPVPGTIAPILPANDQHDLYLINPYKHNNTRYNSLYDHPNSTFPTTSSLHVQHRKIIHKEQRRNSLDFPSSPPPENAKYLYLDNHQHSWSETTNNSHETEEPSVNKTSPLVRHMKELDGQEKSRKRMHPDNTSQEHKRIRNDKIIASP